MIPLIAKPQRRVAALRRGRSLTRGLEALWLCPEGHGPTLYDVAKGYESGSHMTMTNMDPGTDWVGSPYGHAVALGGGNDYLTTGLQLGAPGTFAFWLLMRPNWSASTQYIIDSTDGATGFGLRATSATVLNYFVYRAVGGVSVDNTVAYTDEQWASIVGVMTPTEILLYINGVEVGSSSATTGALVQGANIVIGAQFNGTSPIPMTLAAAAVWKNRYLTPRDVRQLYTAPWSMVARRRTYIFGATATVGGYRLYRAATREALLDSDPVAVSPAGITSISISHADDTAWWYGITTYSKAGVENTDEMRVIYQSVASGVLAGPAPNPITWAQAAPAAGAKIDLSYEYNANNAPGVATGIQVARATGPDGAGVDWGDLIQTITISGNAHGTTELDPTYSDGETVHLAIRAVTAAGDGGEMFIPDGSPVVADSTGPSAVSALVGTQA